VALARGANEADARRKADKAAAQIKVLSIWNNDKITNCAA
jgi:hypothetical protein